MLHIHPVAIHQVRSTLFKRLCDAFHRSVVIEIVIRVHQPYDVPRRHSDTLVDGLVHPVIRFTDDSLDSVSVRFDDLHRPVCRRPVHHNVLNVLVRLCQYTLYGLLYDRSPVITNGDDRNFHVEVYVILHVQILVRRYVKLLDIPISLPGKSTGYSYFQTIQCLKSVFIKQFFLFPESDAISGSSSGPVSNLRIVCMLVRCVFPLSPRTKVPAYR